jgi:hypothetical protein
MLVAMSEAAATKDELADLINVAIEELVRKKYELPAFDTLVRVECYSWRRMGIISVIKRMGIK